jgi:hypothetical protein
MQQADGLFSSLTSVQMKYVTWDSYELAFIQFILFKARQLEVFRIHESRVHLKSDGELECVAVEVAQYRRASPAANVVISRMPQSYGSL